MKGGENSDALLAAVVRSKGSANPFESPQWMELVSHRTGGSGTHRRLFALGGFYARRLAAGHPGIGCHRSVFFHIRLV